MVLPFRRPEVSVTNPPSRTRNRAFAGAVLLGALALPSLAAPSLAFAQRKEPVPQPAAPPPPPTTVTPPVIKKDEGAIYPKEALAAKVRVPVSVVLVLEIDKDGKVTKATVEAPQGNGFDEAATDAARKLEFEPAKKDGTPIAARIKYRIEFAVPRGKLSGRALDTSGVPLSATVTVTPSSGTGAPRTVETDARGAWTLSDLEAGSYRVTIDSPGHASTISTEEVDPGTETNVTQRLEATAPAAGDPKKPAAKAETPIEEVTVRGVRPPREVTKRTFEQRELARMPGTNGDALRAIQNFPGVARPPGLAGLLIVRGAAPQDTNIFVDGTLVPLVYHFGGLSSVIPTEMLEKIDFYPGNFSSQYGRVMGGIVDVGLRDPKKDRLHGMLQVDLIDVRGMAEGPIPFLGKGWSFAVAGRRSYFDTWLGPVLEAVNFGVASAPVYYDYQMIVNKEIDSRQSFKLSFFGSDDRFAALIRSSTGSAPTASGNVNFGTGFYRLQARYRNKVSKNTELRMVGAVGKDALEFGIGDQYFILDSYPLSLRVEGAQKLAPGVTMNLGLDALFTPYDVQLRLPPLPRPGEPPGAPFLSRPPLETSETGQAFRPAVYNEFEIVPWKGARVVTGARLDYSRDTKKWDLSPRFVMRQDVTSAPRTTLKGGLGVFQQPPQFAETNKVFGIEGLSSNRAIHYSLGVEREITKQIEISVEGFYRDLDNLVVQRVGNTGIGSAFGAETLLRYKPDDRFFGFIAYTLSRSIRQDLPTEPERLFNFDQTHILTALGSYRLGGGWEVGARFRLISGSLQTPRQYGFFDQNAGAYLSVNYPPSGERLPMFHQLDVRIDKTWQWKLGAAEDAPVFKLGAYLDLLNAYNSGNVEGYSYNFNSTQRTTAMGLPIIPSIGIRGEL